MSKPIHFPKETKEALSRSINAALRRVDFSNYGYEPNFTPALVQQLHGFSYEDAVVRVTFEGVAVVSMTRGSAESWSGADLSVVTTISQPNKDEVRKATLIQSKIGRVEDLNPAERSRLLEQIKDMRALTWHPKVMEVLPRQHEILVVSGTGLLNDRRLQHPTFGAWIGKRVLPTFDGDTRPSFVEAVLDPRLTTLKINARKK